MTKIEEILAGRSEIAKIQKIQFEVFIYNDVIEAMKEYAEYYAKKCLYLADEEINAYNNITHPTDLELPEHD